MVNNLNVNNKIGIYKVSINSLPENEYNSLIEVKYAPLLTDRRLTY